MRFLKLDYDGPLPDDVLRRVAMLQRLTGIRVENVRKKQTRRGWHVVVKLAEPIPPIVAVAAQAILGSDYRREMHNLSRALKLADAPAFWRERWNVLFQCKL